jgi:hypothetical protein
MDELTALLSNIEIKEDLPKSDFNTSLINKLQGIVKGNYYRKNNLPNALRYAKKIIELKLNDISLNSSQSDGRINSSLDEDLIIKILQNDYSFNNRIFIPNDRHWFDIAIKDFRYGWLVINIKSTTTQTPDNTGNMSMMVYSFTNEPMNIEKKYKNGEMSKTFFSKLKDKQYNLKDKRDYYFLVINKLNNSVIINSVKGLTKIQSNVNNLPFQVKWTNNQHFKYKPFKIQLRYIMETLKKTKPSWQEIHNQQCRNFNLNLI